VNDSASTTSLTSQMSAETPVRVDVGGTPVCLVNVDGTIYAVHDVCTHASSRSRAAGSRMIVSSVPVMGPRFLW